MYYLKYYKNWTYTPSASQVQICCKPTKTDELINNSSNP